jgi:hypothetical protein
MAFARRPTAMGTFPRCHALITRVLSPPYLAALETGPLFIEAAPGVHPANARQGGDKLSDRKSEGEPLKGPNSPALHC